MGCNAIPLATWRDDPKVKNVKTVGKEWKVRVLDLSYIHLRTTTFLDASAIAEILLTSEGEMYLKVRRIDLLTLVICFDLQDDVVGKCKVRYEVKSRHLSGHPKIVYKTRNLTECTDRAQSDIGIHVHSYEEKVGVDNGSMMMVAGGGGGWITLQWTG